MKKHTVTFISLWDICSESLGGKFLEFLREDWESLSGGGGFDYTLADPIEILEAVDPTFWEFLRDYTGGPISSQDSEDYQKFKDALKKLIEEDPELFVNL